MNFRMIHLNSVEMSDAAVSIDEKTYNDLRKNTIHGLTYRGNGAVKTVLVHDFYDLYEVIRNMSLKRRLQDIEQQASIK